MLEITNRPQKEAPILRGQALLVANGDLRQNRNRITWPVQVEMEARLEQVFAVEGMKLERAHPFELALGHGYICSQRQGMDIFKAIDPEAPLVVAQCVWQYSHHLLAGLRDHRGPILTIANWSGQFPGLVGLLNLNACLVKIGKPYSSLWSEDFQDEFFLNGLRQWLQTGHIDPDVSHVRTVDPAQLPEAASRLGRSLARELRHDKAILGVFDEGCMGMYNAILDDELLNDLGIYKERLSQSALLAEMRRVGDAEALKVREWLEGRGMQFVTGADPNTELMDGQILDQCKMYIAALHMAAEFGCAAIGIQYQQGLKDMAPASDLAEGLLNNPDRPPVYHRDTGRALYPQQALPHFNEVDEGAAVDLLVNHRVWAALGFDPSSTVHDIRWGEEFAGEFVWVFMISGAVPASHLAGGYAGARSLRQPPPGFPLGGGTIQGVCKPGEFVWSRVFIEDGCLQADMGRGHATALPPEETARRLQATTPVWPIMHAVLHGVSRDQMMARHRSNHVVVTYAPSAETADLALAARAAMLAELDVKVHFCGV